MEDRDGEISKSKLKRKMKKKSKKTPPKIIEMMCSGCNKVTKHFLSKDENYKCIICGKTNKTIKK